MTKNPIQKDADRIIKAVKNDIVQITAEMYMHGCPISVYHSSDGENIYGFDDGYKKKVKQI